MIDKIIVLIGPPGSGKGFYSSWLQSQYKLDYISSGDISRSFSKKEKSINKIINAGILLSPKFISELIEKKIRSTKNNFILDGFPRNLEQFAFWKSMIDHKKQEIYYLILTCDLSICIERINNRLICPRCHFIYNLKTKKPIKAGRCDQDNTLLIQREDNNKMQKRFHVFENETQPLINFLKKESTNFFRVLELDATKDSQINFDLLKKNLFHEKLN